MGSEETVVRFTLGGLLFEYDPDKTERILKNTESHSPARVFFDYDRIELYDEATVGMKTAMIR